MFVNFLKHGLRSDIVKVLNNTLRVTENEYQILRYISEKKSFR